MWEALAHRTSDWIVVLEDDAIPVPDFRAQLAQALTAAPTPVVSLYLGRKRPPQWQQRVSAALRRTFADDACWITANHMLHAVAIAVRADLVPSLLAHRTRLPWDEHFTTWAQRHGVSYTVPSLVDHADTGTLIAHRDGEPRPCGRVAWLCGRRTAWTDKAVTM